MNTTHRTLTKAFFDIQISSRVQSLLTIASRLRRATDSASRISARAVRPAKYSVGRSLAGIMVASFLAACLLPVNLHAQAPVFAGAQSTLYQSGSPNSVAVDPAGDVFMLDALNEWVVKLPAGSNSLVIVYKGLNVYQAPNGFIAVGGIAVDSQGNLFIADTFNNRVIKVPSDGGITSTVGTGINTPTGVAVDSSGNVYIAEDPPPISSVWPGVVKVAANGGAQTFVGGGYYAPLAVAVDGLNNVYVLDQEGSNVIFKVPANGATPYIVASNLTQPTGIAADAAGNLYIDDSPFGGYIFLSAQGVVELPAGGGPQITLVKPGQLNQPYGIAADGAGDIFVADVGTQSVFELQTKSVNFGNTYVCPAGESNTEACGQTLALNFTQTSSEGFYESAPTTQGTSNLDFKPTSGGGCVASSTGYACTVVITFSPTAIGVREGAVRVSDSAGDVTTIYLRGIGMAPQLAFTPSAQSTIGSGLKSPAGIAMDGAGNVYIADAGNKRVLKVPASGGAQTTVGTGLNSPEAIAVDGAGNVIIVDTGSAQVFKVSPSGVQTAIKTNLTSLTSPDGVAIDGVGNLFISDSFEGAVEVPADGSALISVASGLALGSAGVAVDGAGNVFLADTGNNQLILVPAGGKPVALGANLFKAPNGVAVDAAGDLFVLDGGNDRVVEVNAGGTSLLTIASDLNAPAGLFVDAEGDVIIADTGNNRVLKLARAVPPTLNFGSTAPSTTASGSPTTVMVQNIGNQPLTLTDVNYPKDFPVDFDENGTEALCIGSAAMAPGGVCDLAINFTPLSAGTFNESVALSYKWANLAVPATVSVAVSGSSLKSQTLTFTPPASVTYGATALNLASEVSDSSGLSITLSVLSGPANISGTTVTFTGAGSVVIKASQAGNGSYEAISVEKTITVSKALLTVTATSISIAYGAALPTLQFTIAGFVSGDKSTVVSGVPVETTTAKLGSAPGAYSIAIAQGALKAANYTFAFKNGTLTITSLGVAVPPVFKPSGGTYASAQSITLTDTTPGAVIYYAVHGVVPSTASTKYTGPIAVTSTETIKAIAVAPGYTNSAVVSATYTIQ